MKIQKLKINIQTNKYSAKTFETEIEVPKEMEYYYLADDYKNPTKVRVVDYEVMKSVGNTVYVIANVYNMVNGKLEDYFPESLFETKDKASKAYLNNKYSEE